MTISIGDRVKWQLADTTPGAAAGWGVVIADSPSVGAEAGDVHHVLVEVHSFPQWLGALDAAFHPVIRCAVTWLTKL